MSDLYLNALKEEVLKRSLPISVTENGAIGYKTTGKALLDMNFMLSSMRNQSDDEIWSRFITAYNENSLLSVLWLFFARDVTQGCGERRVFRVVMTRLSSENPKLVVNLLKLIPEYGRWDDLIDLWYKTANQEVRQAALLLINHQLEDDLVGVADQRPISLLGKWMPSETTSSKDTVARARRLQEALKLSPRQYRKRLSVLRGYLRVVECKMSSKKWGEIDYEAVPSKASLLYRNAFMLHDPLRYQTYLDQVQSGEKKINAGTLFPYEIVRAYQKDAYSDDIKMDQTLEAQWKALPNTVSDGQSTLVVVDGSGSMFSGIGNGTGVTALDVAQSLGIYFSERLSGPFRGYFITFSSEPELVHLDPSMSLASKLKIMDGYDDCSNTDLEKTFDLILDTAVRNHLSQGDLPANLLIISDMEFDALSEGHFDYDTYRWCPQEMSTLFDAIRHKFESAGYKLPRLVFWNVMSRTGTIPVTENDLGVALVSGFSPNIADMVMSGEIDPLKCLFDKLTSERYEPVIGAWMGSENR